MEHGNVLFGKKYVACGDSFTQGDFTGYTDPCGLSGRNSPVLYDSEWQMYRTYPYYIAKRNGMTLINEAICGSTMTNHNGDSSACFSVSRYRKIPEDADYITLKFGINDDEFHKKCPIGLIDDTENTTFLGAWNVVLEWLLVNRPYAKLGIIITNGATEAYSDASRLAAERWGIPYLDEVKDPRVPLLHRVNERAGLCERAKQLRMEQLRVTEENRHPNLKAHELESTFVEHFLRSL